MIGLSRFDDWSGDLDGKAGLADSASPYKVRNFYRRGSSRARLTGLDEFEAAKARKRTTFGSCFSPVSAHARRYQGRSQMLPRLEGAGA